VLFAAQFDVIRDLVQERSPPRPDQIRAERLRIIRDTSNLPRTGPRDAATDATP